MTNKAKTIDDIAKQLAAPFDPLDIEWRVQQSGKQSTGKKWAMVLAYVTNRAIQERLDEVFGIGGWQNEFQFMPDGGVVCGLKCRIPTGSIEVATPTFEWITKWDGADKTQIEATKGGLSNAMKRAGVQWGIGRYLYRLETTFVELKEGRPTNADQIPAYIKEFKPNAKDGGPHHFERPKLPKAAIPQE